MLNRAPRSIVVYKVRLLTEHFTIQRPQNPSMNKFSLVQKIVVGRILRP